MKMPATLPGPARRHRNMRLLVAAGKRSRCYLPISSASFGSGACGCGAHAAPKTNSSSRRPLQVAYQNHLGPEEFQVWSQNLGDEIISQIVPLASLKNRCRSNVPLPSSGLMAHRIAFVVAELGAQRASPRPD